MSYTHGRTKTGEAKRLREITLRVRLAKAAADRERAQWRAHQRHARMAELNLQDPYRVRAEADALAAYLRYMKPEDEHLGPIRLEAAAAEAVGDGWTRRAA